MLCEMFATGGSNGESCNCHNVGQTCDFCNERERIAQGMEVTNG